MSAQDPVDRFHNQESPSPQAVGEILREFQTSLDALADRVDALACDQIAGQSRAGADTRRLAVEVAGLGQALARRVKAMEREGSPPAGTTVTPRSSAPKGRSSLWSLGLAILLGLVIAGFWAWRNQGDLGLAAPSPAARAPSLVAAALPPPQVEPAAVSSASPSPPPRTVVRRRAIHRTRISAQRSPPADPPFHAYGPAAEPTTPPS